MSYIPPNEGPALDWMLAFSAGISANPPLYLLTAADATAIANAVNAFAAARAITIIPATRNEVTIADKDDARTSAEQICRQYALLIKFNAGISDGDKINIGVRPVNPDREPIEAPASSPMLNIKGCTPGSQTLVYSDSNTPDSAAKPFGASELQLFVAIADAPVVDPADATFLGKFTRNPIGVQFDAEDNRKQATYFARWASPRGDVGPWSLPVSMAIAA